MACSRSPFDNLLMSSTTGIHCAQWGVIKGSVRHSLVSASQMRRQPQASVFGHAHSIVVSAGQPATRVLCGQRGVSVTTLSLRVMS
jgi:hypothetical protein